MTLAEIKQKIAQVEARIREKELLKATIEGQRQSALRTLKDTHGCENIEAAEALIAKNNADKQGLEAEQQVLEAELRALETKHA